MLLLKSSKIVKAAPLTPSAVIDPVYKVFPASNKLLLFWNNNEGVTVEVVIEDVRYTLPFTVSVWAARLFQFTFVPGVKIKSVTVPVESDTVAPPVLPTYTFGTKVVTGAKFNVPVPEPVKYAFVAPNWFVNVSVFDVAELFST